MQVVICSLLLLSFLVQTSAAGVSFPLSLPALGVSRALRLFQTSKPLGERTSNIATSDQSASINLSSLDQARLDQFKQKRIGVLLLNLGGPEKQEDVEGFLYNLFADPDIIQLPKAPCPLSVLQRPLARVISSNRAKKSAAAYQSIGGGSPIKKYTVAQAEGLQQNLRDMGFSKAKTYIAMRYWEPYTEDALRQIKRDGVQELVVIPLYPHYSISTSASSLKCIQKVFDSNPAEWFKSKEDKRGSGLLERCTVVPYWYNRPEYVLAMAELIAEKYAEFSPEQQREGVDVLYSAHGVPQSYLASGDPYRQQMEDCVTLVSSQLDTLVNEAERRKGSSSRVETFLPGSNGTFIRPSHSPAAPSSPGAVVKDLRCQLAFQSRVGPVEWLRPYTDDVLRDMGAGVLPQGKVKNIIVVPVAFVSEHIETLEEIDIEYRELAEKSGIENWKRAPALNTNARFLRDLATMTAEALLARDISIQDTLSSQLLPVTKKKSKLPFALAIATGAAVGKMIGPLLLK